MLRNIVFLYSTKKRLHFRFQDYFVLLVASCTLLINQVTIATPSQCHCYNNCLVTMHWYLTKYLKKKKKEERKCSLRNISKDISK